MRLCFQHHQRSLSKSALTLAQRCIIANSRPPRCAAGDICAVPAEANRFSADATGVAPNVATATATAAAAATVAKVLVSPVRFAGTSAAVINASLHNTNDVRGGGGAAGTGGKHNSPTACSSGASSVAGMHGRGAKKAPHEQDSGSASAPSGPSGPSGPARGSGCPSRHHHHAHHHHSHHHHPHQRVHLNPPRSSSRCSSRNPFSSFFSTRGFKEQCWRWCNAYSKFCNARPLLSVIGTSALLWGSGDALTQVLEGRQTNSHEVSSSSLSTSPHSFDTRRMAVTVAFGVGIAGLGGAFWYRALDHIVSKRLRLVRGTKSFMAAKLGLEFGVWHPVSLSIFWLMLGLGAKGQSLAEVEAALRADLLTTLAIECTMWLPIDIVNFRFVPLHMQVIVVNIASFFEAILLSYLHQASSHPK